MRETRKIAAILVADIAGYGRLAGADEDRTLSRLRGLRSDLIDPAIAAHQGRVVKRTGDGSLIEFRSVVDAVRCAIEVQNGMVERKKLGKGAQIVTLGLAELLKDACGCSVVHWAAILTARTTGVEGLHDPQAGRQSAQACAL
jgi:class 3 adenylate cyclase